MSEAAWQEANSAYLAASLQWLRLRLRLLAENASTPAAARTASGGFWSFLSSNGAETNRAAEPTATGSSPADQEREAAAARDAAAEGSPPPALLLLAKVFGLSPFERDILLLCAAQEFDPSFGALFAAAGGPASGHPTFGLALRTLESASWDALAPHRPLRQERLVEISQSGHVPLVASPLRADERIVNYVKGLNVLDDRFGALLMPVEGQEDDLAESQRSAVDTVLRRLHEAVQRGQPPLVQLVGSDPGSKLAVARQVAETLHRDLYRIGAHALPRQPAELDTLGRLWQREACLLPLALYIDVESSEGGGSDAPAAVQRLVARASALTFLGVNESPVRLTESSVQVEVARPTAMEQFEAWRGALGGDAPAMAAAEALSGQFNLNLGEIRDLGAAAAVEAAEGEPLAATAWNLSRERTRPRLDALAQRLDAKATWDDLVLPDEQMALMRQIAGQVRERHKVYGEWGFARTMNRGFGISALFAGESGTGKTMAAEVIANDLQLNLYRIDLSAVVSKYIGETEKNLRRLFDAAEQGGAILLFDEADALFGKRSEVKDSHDRYANIEINYLLQRMEAFQGLAILATNMKAALDPAFLRRLRFVVTFQFPGIRERKRIWERALPIEVPVDGVDYDRLAKLNITGGNIHSIALNAAFLAAQARQPVTMPTLLAAAKAEMQKLEKPFHDAELRV